MVKRVSLAVALLCAYNTETVQAEESNYKIRVHKNFMKQILDKNFPVALEHIENKVEKNVFLSEVNANIDDLSLTIKPIKSGWENIETDLFFD